MEGTVLTDAKISNTDLIGVNLKGANLENATLSNVDLTNSNLEQVNIINLKLDGVIFCNTVMPSGIRNDQC